MSDKKGFTLIELLITITIFSVIILGLYSTFHTGVFSYERLDKILLVYQNARKIFNRIDLDLKNTFSYSDNETRFIGDPGHLSFLTLVAGSFSSISYEQTEDKLLRFSSGNPRVLGRNIKELSFSYGFPTGEEDVYNWKDEWGKIEEEKNKLPLAVRIKLILGEIKFEKLVFLPLAK